MRGLRGGGLVRRSANLKSREGGFTLVELLIVIAVITILVGLVVVLMVGITDKARYAKTVSLVRMLDEGCETYKIDYAIYPPNDKTDSRCFHFYLGRPRTVPAQVVPSGPQLLVKKPPIIEFPSDMLLITSNSPPDATQPVAVIDPWENLIRYKNPGQTYRPKGVEIWSPGKNGKDELNPTDPNFDDVTNWVKDY